MINRQMELGLETTRRNSNMNSRHGRKKASWWFEQMRRVVASAPDWQAETQVNAAGQGQGGQVGFSA